MNSKLLQVWLESVNQPVVNEVTEMVQQLFMKVSDNENFSPEQCKEILTAIVTDTPNTSLCGVAASPDSAKNPAVEATGKPETSTAATSAPSIVRQKNLNSRIKNV